MDSSISHWALVMPVAQAGAAYSKHGRIFVLYTVDKSRALTPELSQKEKLPVCLAIQIFSV